MHESAEHDIKKRNGNISEFESGNKSSQKNSRKKFLGNLIIRAGEEPEHER